MVVSRVNEQTNRASSNSIIQVQNLRKDFGYLQALSGVSFNLSKGEFLTIFGPNGAGKTTLIKVLTGLMRPTSGSANINGFDALEGNPELRSQIGVISHSTCLYPDLTALENLLFYAKLYGLKDPKDRAKLSIKEAGLESRKNDLVRTYSRGMQQRIAIARATLHDPSVLFLDEPFTGLDLSATNSLKDQLHGLHTGNRTLIMTTHDMSCGLEICDKVAIQSKGKFLFTEPVTSIDKNNFKNFYTKTIEK